jgi:hypothetical protein
MGVSWDYYISDRIDANAPTFPLPVRRGEGQGEGQLSPDVDRLRLEDFFHERFVIRILLSQVEKLGFVQSLGRVLIRILR